MLKVKNTKRVKCHRYFVNFGSPASAAMWRLSSLSRVSDFGPIAPRVSMATGEKMRPGGRSRYYSVFLSSAIAATFLGILTKILDWRLMLALKDSGQSSPKS